jgi:hypothetical protein
MEDRSRTNSLYLFCNWTNVFERIRQFWRITFLRTFEKTGNHDELTPPVFLFTAWKPTFVDIADAIAALGPGFYLVRPPAHESYVIRRRFGIGHLATGPKPLHTVW